MRRLVISGLLALLIAAGLQASCNAQDGTPTIVTLTLPGGLTNQASTNFSLAVARSASSSLRPYALEYTVAGDVGATPPVLTVKRSAAGVGYKVMTLSTGVVASAVIFESNLWYFLPGDSLYATNSVTNSATLRLFLLER